MTSGYLFNEVKCKIFNPFAQDDTMRSLRSSKPTVNDEDLDKLRKFTEDFGQEG